MINSEQYALEIGCDVSPVSRSIFCAVSNRCGCSIRAQSGSIGEKSSAREFARVFHHIGRLAVA